MARLTEEKIQEIVKEYQVIGTYSGVAKKVGVSPTTVKKYIEQTKPTEPIEKKEKIPFDEPIPDASCVYIPPLEERGKWICLSPDELYEMKELRKEI